QLAQMDTGVPILFCVLTCDTLEQAIDRAGLKGGNKGFEAGLSAVEMAQLSRKLNSSSKNTSSKARLKKRGFAKQSARVRDADALLVGDEQKESAAEEISNLEKRRRRRPYLRFCEPAV